MKPPYFSKSSGSLQNTVNDENKNIFTFFLIVVILASCVQAKWENQHITYYQISLTLPFSTGNYRRIPLTIEVKDGDVISVVDAQGKIVSPEDDEDFAYYYPEEFTISGLYSYAYQTYLKKPRSIEGSYNPTFGYPETIYVDLYTEPCC